MQLPLLLVAFAAVGMSKFLEPAGLGRSYRKRRSPSGGTADDKQRVEPHIAEPTKPDLPDRPKTPLPPGKVQKIIESAGALNRNLFTISGYDDDIRPLRNSSKKVEVIFTLQPIGISFIDPLSRNATIIALNCMVWRDEWLTWNVTEYAGISSLRVEWYRIWIPPLGPGYGLGMSEKDSSPIILSHTGQVAYCLLAQFSAPCNIDFIRFPYDKHTCELTFYVDQVSAKRVHFEETEIRLEKEIRHGEWSMDAVEWEHEPDRHEDQTAPVQINLRFHLKRNSEHFWWSLCVPTASLLLVCLTSSWIPQRHLSVRQVLLSGLLFGNVLLLIHAGTVLEGADQLPTIMLLQCVSMGLITLNILATYSRQVIASASGREGKLHPQMTKSVLAKVDVFGLPAAGFCLIVWVLGVF